ncbi:hypothetical protein F0562_005186 [Nyssa sinensis]|uniref:Serpin domain-containing protein n=1 Tax=Nyssa sinensis TaxID=561372 RepID=A0A5J5ALU8_9ASTE|nr:hypothetical protein F0562_005186 [Nyssa sinensis]
MLNQVLLREADIGSNFVLSPLTFHVLLNLLAVGSTGRTLEQLLFYLGSKNIDDLNLLSSQIVALITTTVPSEGKSLPASPLLSFVNGVWVDQRFSLKPSFKGIVEGVYKAEAREVDFLNKFEASESIKQVGLKEPFMNLGELTEMVDSPHGGRLCLSKIIHKSYIEVNEDGTEAAASNALITRFYSGRYPTPSFVADHPFMFMIKEETSQIVFFIGAVLNPLLVS